MRVLLSLQLSIVRPWRGRHSKRSHDGTGQFDGGQIDLDQAECVRNAAFGSQCSGSNRAHQVGNDGVVERHQARDAATSGLRDWFRAAYCARASQRLLRASVAWPFTHFH